MKEKTLKNGGKAILRNIIPNDAEKIINHYKIAGGETNFLSFGAEGILLTVDEEKEVLEKMLSQENSDFICVEIDGYMAGCLSINGNKRKRMKHCVEFGISVEKKYWGIGIGRLLLDEMILICKDNGIRKINLKTSEDNERAINLYKSYGFEIEGRLKNECCIDGKFSDTYCMALQMD